MKTALIAFGEFVLFVVVFLLGSFWNPLGLRWMVSHPTLASTRFFVPTGLLLAIGLYVLILLIAVLRKRLPATLPAASIALVLALAFGWWQQFGWLTV